MTSRPKKENFSIRDSENTVKKITGLHNLSTFVLYRSGMDAGQRIRRGTSTRNKNHGKRRFIMKALSVPLLLITGILSIMLSACGDGGSGSTTFSVVDTETTTTTTNLGQPPSTL
jgi:hypothetical protein